VIQWISDRQTCDGLPAVHQPGAEDKEPVGEARFIFLWAYKTVQGRSRE
jgi:hypothetical protein